MHLQSKSSYLFGAFTREKYATQKNITKQGNWFYGFGEFAYKYGGNHDYLDLFLTNPSLGFAVGKLAQYVSDAVFYVDVEGEEDFTNEVTNLFNKPNPDQSKQDFLREWLIYSVLFGFDVIYDDKRLAKKTPDISNTKSLRVLNPKYLKSYKRSIMDILRNVNKDFAFKYTESSGGKVYTRKFKENEIIKFYDGASGIEGDLQKGYSRVKSLEIVLDNIRKALEGENVILGNPGGFGLISNASKDAVGSMTFADGEKDEIENRLSNNGVYGNQFGQKQWIASEHDLNVHQFTSRLKDYTYNENYKQNHLKVCNAFGIPKELAGFDDSKFENKETVEVQFYTNICQNYIDNFCQSFTEYYQLENPLRATYKFVPSVSNYQFESKKKETEHLVKAADMCSKLLALGVPVEQIQEQYQELTGYQIEINEEAIQERRGKIEVQNQD